MLPILKQFRAGLCLLLLCITTMLATAQNPTQLSKIYGQVATGMGTYESVDFDLGIKAVLNNKWSLGLTFKGSEMTPKNQPADYEPGIEVLIFIPIEDYVKTDMSFLTASFGRYFKLNRTVWATTEAGISYVHGEKVAYTPREVDGGVLLPGFLSSTSNYSTTKEGKSTVGVALQADINWAFASFMGLGLGVHTNLNSIQSPVGFNIKLIVGKMGREKKHKQ